MNMNKFRITCPECGAEIVAVWPQTVIWELCPSCRHHVWDGYDAMMADVVLARTSDGDEAGIMTKVHNN
jgi:Zn-finger nucleic acid-binding protein